MRSGVVNARGRLVLFADADGATPIVQVSTRLYRRLIGRSFHWLVQSLAVGGIEDTQCGFKLFRGAVAHDLFSHTRAAGFSFDVKVLMLAQRRGYRIAEVPVNWIHQSGSKVNLVLDPVRMARDLVFMRSRHLSGEYDRPHLAAWAAPLKPAGTVRA